MGRAGTRRLVGVATVAAVLALGLALLDTGRGGAAHAVIADCTGADAIDFACYQRRYRTMTAIDGPRAAIGDLSERSRRVGYLRAACHQLMHVIGRDAGRRDGIRSFEEGDESCSSGFFHGVVEAVMARIGAARIRKDAATVCAPFRTEDAHGMAQYNCAHGTGHGFMEVYSGDVFRSLAGCRALGDRWEERHCEGGVFMQNLTAMADPRRPARNLRPEQPLYPCTAVARRYKHECYMKQTAYALFVRDHDFQAVFKLCAASPDVAFRPDCYQGVGGDASIRASKYVTGAVATRRTIRVLCRLAPDGPARRHCVVGAVTVIVRDGASEAADPVTLCASFRERDLRAACSRAHLKVVQEVALDGGSRRDGVALNGHAPALVCRMAARLESTSARTSEKQGEREDLQ